MNTVRIAQALKDIEDNTVALKWLEEYGVKLDGRSSDSIGITVNPSFAGSCVGAKEAAKVLASFIRLDIDLTVKTAITNCRNTIELARAAIAEEAARP